MTTKLAKTKGNTRVSYLEALEELATMGYDGIAVNSRYEGVKRLLEEKLNRPVH